MNAFASDRQAIGAVHNHDAVMVSAKRQRSIGNERMVRLIHIKAVLIHERHAGDFHAIQFQRRKNGIQDT